MVPLGHGSYVRADLVFAVIPIEGPERGHGRRSYVDVEGLPGPLIASRSERAIMADIERVLAGETLGRPRRRLLRLGTHRSVAHAS
jgi:hypothetical protein